MVLAHFLTLSWKKRELQSMDNVQVKHFSNLLPSDIHRQKSQLLHLMIKMSLILYRTWLKKDELDSLENDVEFISHFYMN